MSFLNLFKKPTSRGKVVVFKISGMHCTSCATNIDLTLEELEGIYKANTNYQKNTLEVDFDPKRIDLTVIMSEVGKLGYAVELLDKK